MTLRIAQRVLVQRIGLKPRIGVARKGEGGRAAVGPVLTEPRETFRVQPGEITGDAHEFHQLVHRQFARDGGQRVRVILKARLGHRGVAVGPVEPFGRGNHGQHMMRLLV